MSNNIIWENLLKKISPFGVDLINQKEYEESDDKFFYLIKNLLHPLVVEYNKGQIESPIIELLDDAKLVAESILSPATLVNHKIFKLQKITQYLEKNQFLLNVIHLAHKSNKNILIVNPVNFTIQIGSGKNSIWLSHTATDKDSYLGTSVCHNKVSSYHFIGSLDYPQPRQELLTNKTDLIQVIDFIGFPCVIKPVDGHKGNGIIIGIDNLGALKKTCSDFIRTRPIGIIQQQVFGNDYRLVVIDGKLDFVVMREYPSVTGDGINNIRRLIIEKNKDLIDFSGSYGINGIITVNDNLLTSIKNQGHTLDSIPKDNEKIILSHVANINQGGTRKEIPLNDVHPEIIQMVETLAISSRVYTLGVDIISKDISKPIVEGETKVIELNTNPEFIQQRAETYYNKLIKDKNIEIEFEKLDLSTDLKPDYFIIVHKTNTCLIDQIRNSVYSDRLITYDNINNVLLNSRIEKAYIP